MAGSTACTCCWTTLLTSTPLTTQVMLHCSAIRPIMLSIHVYTQLHRPPAYYYGNLTLEWRKLTAAAATAELSTFRILMPCMACHLAWRGEINMANVAALCSPSVRSGYTQQFCVDVRLTASDCSTLGSSSS